MSTLSRRDQNAQAAMAALLSNPVWMQRAVKFFEEKAHEAVALQAYKQADAMEAHADLIDEEDD